MSEPTETLARSLRTRRVELGWSLDDVRERTRVPRHALVALEAGRVAELPASPVTKGFALAYAQSVGLDPGLVHACWPTAPEPARATPAPRGSAWRWVVVLLLVLLPLCLLGWWLSRAAEDQLGEAGQASVMPSPTPSGPARMRG